MSLLKFPGWNVFIFDILLTTVIEKPGNELELYAVDVSVINHRFRVDVKA